MSTLTLYFYFFDTVRKRVLYKPCINFVANVSWELPERQSLHIEPTHEFHLNKVKFFSKSFPSSPDSPVSQGNMDSKNERRNPFQPAEFRPGFLQHQ